MAAFICNDCMSGYHEISGHDDCECSCHNNPTCFVCGACKITDEEFTVGAHVKCYEQWNDEREYKRDYESSRIDY